MKRILNWLSVHGWLRRRSGDGDCDGGVGAQVTRWRVRVVEFKWKNSPELVSKN